MVAAESALQLHSALKASIKRAIVVMDALGDPEMRFQSMGQVWGRAIDDAGMAYGYSATRVRVVPTAREIAQADVVADWLAWLGAHHGGVRLLVSWAHDDPIWRIAEREQCSERTIHNRIDRSIAAILTEFGGVELGIDIIDEPPRPAHGRHFISARPTAGNSPVIDQHGRVWIDGVGFMKNGKRWNDGRNKIKDGMIRAH